MCSTEEKYENASTRIMSSGFGRAAHCVMATSAQARPAPFRVVVPKGGFPSWCGAATACSHVFQRPSRAIQGTGNEHRCHIAPQPPPCWAFLEQPIRLHCGQRTPPSGDGGALAAGLAACNCKRERGSSCSCSRQGPAFELSAAVGRPANRNVIDSASFEMRQNASNDTDVRETDSSQRVAVAPVAVGAKLILRRSVGAASWSTDHSAQIGSGK